VIKLRPDITDSECAIGYFFPTDKVKFVTKPDLSEKPKNLSREIEKSLNHYTKNLKGIEIHFALTGKILSEERQKMIVQRIESKAKIGNIPIVHLVQLLKPALSVCFSSSLPNLIFLSSTFVTGTLLHQEGQSVRPPEPHQTHFRDRPP
jgi:hypothetical protein